MDQSRRQNLLEAAVAILGVSVFIAITLAAGAAFEGPGLTESGALALVGGIVVFILLMAGIGYWLSRQ